MGKNKRAAKAAWRAAARAALPLPTTTNIGHPLIATAAPFDTHAALVDTPSASAVRESPQQLRVSHEADATHAPRAATPTYPTIDITLVREPAIVDAHAKEPVAIATPQMHVAHELDSCPEPRDMPPALTMPTSTPFDTIDTTVQQTRVSNPANTLIAPRTPIPALSASATTAVVVLAAAIDVLGPPTVFLACLMHLFDRAEDLSHELDALAPRICPATSIEEIDEDLLANIIEDAQSLTRIEARREVRVKALEEGRERGWKEGLEEGRREARKEARKDATADMRQQEQGWKDAYELGRWDGYREGLEIASTEVSTRTRVDATVYGHVT
ncbi:hypothetical protein EWM64_g10062 [Hericium alpestre]|uniref:Essential protein Yae1 N-terminal domain-containing protein n=1 Tax=Hericium alpestre TaxID=135208 RepID=A0A4Y9ZIC5_9AGAM|nr:hypothetical protein EWM64_g10062 [Hericium alpestre]